ncbi:hypothetical protein DPEC_G00101600 [Dallia pectoralis]|uniref:Uncharacterized protein n=1 Tax=Dallia pectoralis TaxID=75939 RepID=A0ACC2GX02_DALPE|nr:hypothetical protein DPEC_G00101600 [Dallia pectoralis]
MLIVVREEVKPFVAGLGNQHITACQALGDSSHFPQGSGGRGPFGVTHRPLEVTGEERGLSVFHQPERWRSFCILTLCWRWPTPAGVPSLSTATNLPYFTWDPPPDVLSVLSTVRGLFGVCVGGGPRHPCRVDTPEGS